MTITTTTFDTEYKRMRAISDFMRRCIFDVPPSVIEVLDTEWDTITLDKIKQLINDSKPLEDMPKTQLKRLAKRYKVKGWSRLPKTDLIIELWHLHEVRLEVGETELKQSMVKAVTGVLDELGIRILIFDTSFTIGAWAKDTASIFDDIISLSKVMDQSVAAVNKIKEKTRLLHHRYPSNFKFGYA